MDRRAPTLDRSDPRRATAHALLAAALVLLLMAAAWPLPAQAQSQTETWGVARAYREFDDPPLLRDNQKQDYVTIVNSRETPVTMTVHAQDHPRDPTNPAHDWGDAGAWLDLHGLDRLTVPANDQVDVPYTVHVPGDAANGRYGAEIRFEEVEDDGGANGEGASATLVTAHTAVVFIEVSGEQMMRIESREEPRVRDAEEQGLWVIEVALANTGNVRANPHVRIEVWDKLQTSRLRTYWFNDTFLDPGEAGFYPMRVQGMDLAQDQYWTRVTVYLGDEVVKESGFRTFDVLEPGALKRLAELQTIRIGDGRQLVAKEGDLVRLTILWRNTGELPVLGTFKGTVMRDGALVDTLESDERELDVGQTGELEIIYEVTEAGRYEFLGRVHYGPKVTEERSAILEVQSGFGGGWLWAGIGLGVLVVLGVLLLVLRRRSGTPPAKRSRAATARGRGTRPAHPQRRSAAAPPQRRPGSSGPARARSRGRPPASSRAAPRRRA